MTNLDIASIAQQIQDNSSENVSVSVEFNLNPNYCTPWLIHIHVWSEEVSAYRVSESIRFDYYSSDLNKHRMMMLAKFGYKAQYIK